MLLSYLPRLQHKRRPIYSSSPSPTILCVYSVDCFCLYSHRRWEMKRCEPINTPHTPTRQPKTEKTRKTGTAITTATFPIDFTGLILPPRQGDDKAKRIFNCQVPSPFVLIIRYQGRGIGIVIVLGLLSGRENRFRCLGVVATSGVSQMRSAVYDNGGSDSDSDGVIYRAHKKKNDT